MNIKVQEICAQLLPATINGVYQGILLSLVVGALLRLFIRTNAATRHAIWFGSLMLVVLLIPVHYWLDRVPGPERSAYALPIEGGVANDPGPTSAVHQQAGFAWFDLNTEHPKEIAGADSDAETSQSESNDQTADHVLSTNGRAPTAVTFQVLAPAQGADSQISLAKIRDAAMSAVQTVLQPIHWHVDSAAAFPIAAILFVLWLILASSQLIFLVLKLRGLLRLREETQVPPPGLRSLFEKLKTEAGVRRRVELRVSRERRCPMLIGYLRPFIVLPEELAEDRLTETEQVLRHELAHVTRFDDWINLVQHLIQSVLFFHPSVWWINRRLSLEREIACDDYVLEQCGRRQDYALTLTNVASRLRHRAPMLAPGVSNSSSQLQQRIHMILNTRRDASPRLAKGRTTLIISSLAFLALLTANSGPRFILAAAPVPAPHPVISVETTGPAGTPQPAIAVVESLNIEPAVETLVAQAEPPAVVAVGVDPGPKFKPNPAAPEEPGEPGEPGAVITPEPPDFPRTPKVVAPRVARGGRAPKARAQDADDEKDADGSIEDRLRRLEKMVRALMEQQGAKRSHGEFTFKDGSERNLNIDQQALDKMKQSAERQAARAAEQAQRAAEQMKRSNRELEARLDQEDQGRADYHEAFQHQIEALRKARESLNQEMEKINRQIEKLEKEQQRKEKDQQRRSEADAEKLQADNPVVPAPVK